jgi:hypothetical protein
MPITGKAAARRELREAMRFFAYAALCVAPAAAIIAQTSRHRVSITGPAAPNETMPERQIDLPFSNSEVWHIDAKATRGRGLADRERVP